MTLLEYTSTIVSTQPDFQARARWFLKNKLQQTYVIDKALTTNGVV